MKIVLSFFFLYVKWLAFRQIGNRNRGENILWCYECPQALAAVKTSNEAFGPHLASLALERIFLQKISYLMSSTGHHFDFRILASIYMLLQLTFYLPHGTAPLSQMDPDVGRTQRKYRHYIHVFPWVSDCNLWGNFILPKNDRRHYSGFLTWIEVLDGQQLQNYS